MWDGEWCVDMVGGFFFAGVIKLVGWVEELDLFVSVGNFFYVVSFFRCEVFCCV